MISAYPKIFTIGTDYIMDIFKEPVEITEKVDGSQFVFGKIEYELYIRSKGQQLFPEAPQSMFKDGIDYVVSIQDKLPNNIIFYCEYLQKPKHNVLKYNRTPKNHLIMFGASTPLKSFDRDFARHADLLDIEVVPVIFQGIINNPEELLSMLNTDSVLGDTTVEGIVVKNYDRPFLLGGQPIPLMAGKFVSEKFKEVHNKEWKQSHTTSGRWDVFKSRFRSEARWQKAVQHLREQGLLQNEPRDIGQLIKEIQADIEAEEIETIKTFLWEEFGKEILRTSIKGFPEWYKEQLLHNSFQKETT